MPMPSDADDADDADADMTTEDRVVVKVHRHNPVHHEDGELAMRCCIALLDSVGQVVSSGVKWQESYKVGEHGVVLEAILELMAHESQEWHFFTYRTWFEMNARLKWIYLQEVWGRQQATISTVASTHGKDFNFGVAVPLCPAN